MSLGKGLINVGLPACTTDTADIFGDGNGKALYTFDYDGSDESANGYHLTPTGVTFGVGGNINYGLRGGESNSMMANTSIGYNYSDITVSWWVKLEGTGSTRLTFSNGGGLKFAFMRIHYNTTASQYRADLFTRTGTTSGTNSLVGYALIDTSLNGSWVHLGMRMGNTLEDSIRNGIYINGTKSTMSYSVGNATSSAGVDDASPNRFYIGYYYSSALQEAFSIDIDHLRIFNRALTASEIGQLAAEEACEYTATANTADFPSTATAVAHYPLDNSSEDNHGNTYDGTDTNIEYRFGRYGQAAVFNGSSSYITTPSIIPANNFSFSIWVNLDVIPASSSNLQIIYNINRFADNVRWYISVTTGGKVEAWNGANTFITSSNHIVNTGQWYHITYTASSTTGKKIYVDGIEVFTSSDTGNNQGTATTTDWQAFGRYFNASAPFYLDGKLDQVRIFSTALTSDQVTELYNEKPETDTSNFKTVLYEGTGATQYISNIGYNLDAENGGDGGMLWIKERTSTSSHRIVDSVRGDTKRIFTNNTGSEASTTEGETLEANGFFIGADNGSNQNNEDYVAWVWKGGGVKQNGTGTNVSNVEYSANTEAGFSIVKYTGGLSSSAGASASPVSHGLGAAPNLIIFKNLDNSSENWHVYGDFGGTPWGKGLRLNNTNALDSTDRNISAPDSTNFYTQYLTVMNTSGNDHIAYCFRSISSGHSKIGTYTGEGTSGKPYPTMDFKPSWVLIKNITTSGTSWLIYDTVRSADDQMNDILYADLSNAEAANVSTAYITSKSNGFEVNNTSSYSLNFSGDTYLYMAFK